MVADAACALRSGGRCLGIPIAKSQKSQQWHNPGEQDISEFAGKIDSVSYNSADGRISDLLCIVDCRDNNADLMKLINLNFGRV